LFTSSILTSERNLWHVYTCHAYCSLLVFTRFNTTDHLKPERKTDGRKREYKEERREKREERETSYFRAEIKSVTLFYGSKASLARPADRSSIK
jgi:hypothetical protein